MTDHNRCGVCGRIVQSYETDHDYHKGYTTRWGSRKTLYPFEEKKFTYPEGSMRRVYVCQDCLDPVAQMGLIKRTRMETIEKEIALGGRQDEWDKADMGALRKRRKENKEKVRKLKEYLENIENEITPKHSWDSLKIDRGKR